MKEWALVTGASSGIGLELARRFAADHIPVALVARDADRLNHVAAALRAEHPIQTRVLVKDLSVAGATSEIARELRDVPVGAVVNNAGFGWKGAFAQCELENCLRMMHVNMDALVELTHRFLPPMLARGEGRILNVASTAAFQPGPTAAIYFATKAFVYSFSCALAEELRGSGVTVTALCPGSTETDFHRRAGMERAVKRMPRMEARTVAEIAYRAMKDGDRVVIPGVLNKITAAMAKRMPERLTSSVVRRLYKR
jgi:short-subunit dehydrogenase